MTRSNVTYPVVDLFAGPGGIGEGFANLHANNGKPVFRTMASIERDVYAHQTLLLRHFFRSFRQEEVPDSYYDYISGYITKDELIQKYPLEWQHAKSSALKITLGDETHDQVKKLIKQRLGKTKKWVLVGGPPCQAYSLVGRSRMMSNPDFEGDERHFLYKEYLKIIIDHRPPVFVMENVKGILSAKVNGKLVIQKIVNDLSSPIKAITHKKNGLAYRLFSLSQGGELNGEIDPKDFIVKSEEYGVPQARHRMFIVGIRSDINIQPCKLDIKKSPSVQQVIGCMPKVRSGISRQEDSYELWQRTLCSVSTSGWYKTYNRSETSSFKSILSRALTEIESSPLERSSNRYRAPRVMRSWYYDDRIRSLASHEVRSHMNSDLHRYLFAATHAEAFGVSPKLVDFPIKLLPEHKNVNQGREGKMFSDRFRVQVGNHVSTTVTSHISKDGHYFIHYDPAQCRSLTVAEAARLQTFPDNYHFEGPRTSQYHQVGNAIPVYLAHQIAEIISEVLASMKGAD